MSTRKVRIGIIGTGGIANVHARYYKQLPNVELVAGTDIIKENVEEFAKKWGIPEKNIFTDYKEMIESVEMDAVSITTPHKLHAEPTIFALKRGLHVLVEKPMASTGQEAYEMYKASLEVKRILMVGFQTRFAPELIAARKIVRSGFLGEFYYGETLEDGKRRRAIPTSPTFYTKEFAGGGVTLDLGCYAIDDAMYILDFPEVERVSGNIFTAIGKNKEAIVEGGWGAWDVEKFEVEDFVVAKITLKNGGILLLKESWAMHNDELGRPFYLGTKGGIKLKPLELFKDEFGYMTSTKVILPNKDPWIDKIGKFVDAVANNKPSPIDPKEIVYEQFILDAIYSSAKEGGKEIKPEIPSDVLPKKL